MKTVLLTGGIGSGKSAVAEYLRSKGVPVYDSDSMTKRLYDSDKQLIADIEQALGAKLTGERATQTGERATQTSKRVKLTGEDGKLDRKALAAIIFSSEDALSRLESVVHPAVLRDFCRWRDTMDLEFREGVRPWYRYSGGSPFVVMESAIAADKPLFEGTYDAVVLVDAPLQMRVERAALRDSAPKEAILRRVEAQKTDLSRADAVINNDLDLDTLAQRTDIAFKLLYL